MKKSITILCFIACAAFAAWLDESFALVVRRSSGIAPEGTVLYCETPRSTFTNGPLRLTFPKALHPLVTNVFTVGAVTVTNVQEGFDIEFSLRDARSGKVFHYNWMNRFYVCGNEFVFLSETNLSAQVADDVHPPLMRTLPPGFEQCADLTNTLSLAEADARGIGIELREVVTLEMEPDELGRARAVMRRRWVFASEPFGEGIPAPEAAW